MKKSIHYIVTLFSFLISMSSLASEHVLWQSNQVIDVTLITGKERKITFPEVVKMWQEPVFNNLYRYSFIDRSLFIEPRKNSQLRVTFQGVDSGRVYILSFGSVDDNQVSDLSEDLVIHIKDVEKESSSGTDIEAEVVQSKSITHVSLTQYAAQSLFSEIIEPLPGVHEVSVIRSPVRGLYQSGRFEATPVKSWSSGRLYVTAVLLRNVTSDSVTFEPCRIKGDFIGVTPQHLEVKPFVDGDKMNRHKTIAYFLSDVPFGSAAAKRITKCRSK